MKHSEIQQIIETDFKIKGNDNLPYRGFSKDCNRIKLVELFGRFDFRVGVEVGTKVGKYAELLCNSMPNLSLSCVDPWKPYGELFTDQEKHNLYYEEAKKRLDKYNVSILRMESMEALQHFPNESIDFVYIDGNHEFDFVCSDLIFWSWKVKSGGIVAGHDYYHFYKSGVVDAVNAYTKCHNINPWYITRENEPTYFWIKP